MNCESVNNISDYCQEPSELVYPLNTLGREVLFFVAIDPESEDTYSAFTSASGTVFVKRASIFLLSHNEMPKNMKT